MLALISLHGGNLTIFKSSFKKRAKIIKVKFSEIAEYTMKFQYSMLISLEISGDTWTIWIACNGESNNCKEAKGSQLLAEADVDIASMANQMCNCTRRSEEKAENTFMVQSQRLLFLRGLPHLLDNLTFTNLMPVLHKQNCSFKLFHFLEQLWLSGSLPTRRNLSVRILKKRISLPMQNWIYGRTLW